MNKNKITQNRKELVCGVGNSKNLKSGEERTETSQFLKLAGS
jgi:hypothetical protein